MPMPTPGPTEDKNTFISRCMGDDTMNRDFPDQDQRAAVCNRQWDDKDKPKAWLLPETPQCWSNHLGLWCIEPLWFTQAVQMFRLGLWQEASASSASLTAFDRGALSPEALRRFETMPPQAPGLRAEDVQIVAAERRPYDVTKQGTALIPLMGPLSKAGSYKFGGTSTVRTQRALRLALADEEVSNGLIHIDSPGGHVAGIESLATEVARWRGRKPIVAQIDDLGASAAYWVASQADAIYANPTAEVGSIGTIAVVEDTSNRMDRLGIKVHVISTGPYKGVGVDGAPISESALAYLHERVAAINGHFLQAVQRGRGFDDGQLAAIADGRVFIAGTAYQHRLIDRVQSLDETIAQLSSSPSVLPGRQGRLSQAQARLARAAAFVAQGGAHASHDGSVQNSGN
jgi:signal peptide peptidase SppA